MRIILIATGAALLVATPASARELFGGVYLHAVDTPLSLGGGREEGIDLQLGYRWNSLGRTGLQPYALVSLNSAGETHFAVAGLSYRYGRKFYVRPAVGIAVHTGSAGEFEREDRLAFGSRVLFAPELGVGVQLNDRASVEASLTHLSHAQISGRQNPGIDNIGVRLNWRL